MEKMVNESFIREITPLSEKDCFYIADRHKKEFTYPMHSHREFELNFVEHAPGYAVLSEIRKKSSVTMTWC